MTILFNIFSLNCQTNFRQYFSANICRRCLKSKHSLHWHAIWWDTFFNKFDFNFPSNVIFFQFHASELGYYSTVECWLTDILFVETYSKTKFIMFIFRYHTWVWTGRKPENEIYRPIGSESRVSYHMIISLK